MKNAYDILGVPETATDAQIKIAFRAKSKTCHPDQGGNAKEFEELKKSYDILRDPGLREDHDLAILKHKGADVPDEHIDTSLAEWFDVGQQVKPAYAHPQPKQTKKHHGDDRRCPDEPIPDGFGNGGFFL